MSFKKVTWFFILSFLSLLVGTKCERPNLCDGTVSDAKGIYVVKYTKREYHGDDSPWEDSSVLYITVSDKGVLVTIGNDEEDEVECSYISSDLCNMIIQCNNKENDDDKYYDEWEIELTSF